MCGRFVTPEERAIAQAFHLQRASGHPFSRRFNVCPTDTIPLLRMAANSAEIELAAGRWGLVPHWWGEAKPPKLSFNARLEEVAEKPMWRDAWARARCLIPAEGWYEWQAVELLDPATGEIKRARQPCFVRRKDSKLFCFAGLMAYWRNPKTGETLRSCAVLTAAAAGPLAAIHPRAPVVLPSELQRAWLDRKLVNARQVRALAEVRVPPWEFAHWKVRPLVNDVKADGPQLIDPAESGDPAVNPTSAG